MCQENSHDNSSNNDKYEQKHTSDIQMRRKTKEQSLKDSTLLYSQSGRK